MKAKRTFIDFIFESGRFTQLCYKSMEQSVQKMEQELIEMASADQDIQVEKLINQYSQSDQKVLNELQPSEKEPVLEKKPQITAEKIVEFIEQALQSHANGEAIDDDQNVSEISSLRNQFKVITSDLGKNIKQKFNVLGGLGKLFTPQHDPEKELRTFIYSLLDGEIIKDHQIEQFCSQLEQSSNRCLVVEVLQNCSRNPQIIVMPTGLTILSKLFFMKAIPNRDWANLTNFVLCFQGIESKRNWTKNENYKTFAQQFGDHFVFGLEEFWVGCTVHLCLSFM